VVVGQAQTQPPHLNWESDFKTFSPKSTPKSNMFYYKLSTTKSTLLLLTLITADVYFPISKCLLTSITSIF
jgi:hypothetical protein